jgi:hypothetical protein
VAMRWSGSYESEVSRWRSTPWRSLVKTLQFISLLAIAFVAISDSQGNTRRAGRQDLVPVQEMSWRFSTSSLGVRISLSPSSSTSR